MRSVSVAGGLNCRQCRISGSVEAIRARIKERFRLVLLQSRWRLAVALLAGLFLLTSHVARQPAHLTVTTSPPGAAIRVDTTYRGTAPVEIELDGGDHTVTAEADKKPAVQRTVTLQPGEHQSLDITIP